MNHLWGDAMPTSTLLSPSPVEAVTGIWKFTRPPSGPRRARSLPGHLLHCVESGSYRLRTNGREYGIQPGDIIHYYESEEVEWLGSEETVVFYSVGFLAPSIPAPPFEHRVFPATAETQASFANLHAASIDTHRLRRDLGVHSELLTILRFVTSRWSTSTTPPRGEADRWWNVEADIRRRRRYRQTLDEIADHFNVSKPTIVRWCRKATGLSPSRRVRVIRMEEAKGLLTHSTLNVTGVADYLGYPRMHEFSREFKRHFGFPPTSLAQGAKVIVPKRSKA